MMRLFFFLVFIGFSGPVSAQSDCFSDCKQRSLAAWDALQKRGISSTDSALSCDTKITEDLKGCAFPDVPLNRLGGGTFKIDELKGNVVVVHFWFVSCATCVAEMPSINKLNELYAGQPVKFLAVSFDSPARLDGFFAKGRKMDAIQTYLDQQTLEKTFCILNTYPLNLVLDKDGNVIDAWTEENPEAGRQDAFFAKVKSRVDAGLTKPGKAIK